jgi:hypothetical protein
LSDEDNIERSSTANLKHDHFTLKRVGAIAQRCSDKLYADDEDIPIGDIEILSVVIEELLMHSIMARKKRLTFQSQRARTAIQRMFANS